MISSVLNLLSKERLFINNLDENLELIDFINNTKDDLITLSSNEIDIENIKGNSYIIRWFVIIFKNQGLKWEC